MGEGRERQRGLGGRDIEKDGDRQIDLHRISVSTFCDFAKAHVLAPLPFSTLQELHARISEFDLAPLPFCNPLIRSTVGGRVVAGGARHVTTIPEMIEWGSLPAEGVMSRQFHQLLALMEALMECQSNSANVVCRLERSKCRLGWPEGASGHFVRDVCHPHLLSVALLITAFRPTLKMV